MIFKYGSYSHPNNEVSLVSFQIQPKMSPRGQRISTVFTMHLQGEILGNGQADLTTKINTLINTYANDYQDAGLYYDDGVTATPHVLDSDHPDNLTGNIVLYRNWPHGLGNSQDGAEYATKRSFSIGIRAEFRNAYSSLLYYKDSIEHIGTGGPIYVWRNRPPGFAPVVEQVATQSVQTIIHSGTAVGLNGYPFPPQLLLPEPYFQPNLARVKRIGPDRYHQGFQGYTINWSYTYQVPFSTPLFPTIR